jgi:hypothetical protein
VLHLNDRFDEAKKMLKIVIGIVGWIVGFCLLGWMIEKIF